MIYTEYMETALKTGLQHVRRACGYNGHHDIIHNAIWAAAATLIQAGREAAAQDIEADPGIPIYINREPGDQEQHDDPVLLRSHAASIARGTEPTS